MPLLARFKVMAVSVLETMTGLAGWKLRTAFLRAAFSALTRSSSAFLALSAAAFLEALLGLRAGCSWLDTLSLYKWIKTLQ